MISIKTPIINHRKLWIITTLSALCCSHHVLAATQLQSMQSQSTAIGIPSHSQSAVLPNAYSLTQRMDAQQAEIARLTDVIETLQMEQLTTRQQIETLKTRVITLSEQLEQQSYQQTNQQVAHTTPQSTANNNANVSDTTQNDTLMLTNENIINAPTNTHDSQVSTETAEQAYAAAYTTLKEQGAQSAVEKMQAFIDNYPQHKLIANAHYWLGEFYLKLSPPDISSAQSAFKHVANEYAKHPDNDKQSKALYRLATLAKQNKQSDIAQNYIKQLITQYPESNEAKLAKSVKW